MTINEMRKTKQFLTVASSLSCQRRRCDQLELRLNLMQF